LGCLKLSELITALRGRQWPLGFIKDTCYLRITWEKQTAATNDNGKVVCKTNGAALAAPVVSKTNVKVVSDHLFFSDEAMGQLKRQIDSDAGLSFVYADEILTTAAIPIFTNPANGSVTDKLIEQELALSGRTVRSLTVMDSKSKGHPKHPVRGAYVSQVGTEGVEDNYVINDRRKFDRRINSPSKHAQQTALAFGSPPQVPSQAYSWDTDSSKDGSVAPFQTSVAETVVEGIPWAEFASSDFRGQKFVTALDLTTSPMNVLGSGTLIGNKAARFQRRYKVTRGHKFRVGASCVDASNSTQLFSLLYAAFLPGSCTILSHSMGTCHQCKRNFVSRRRFSQVNQPSCAVGCVGISDTTVSPTTTLPTSSPPPHPRTTTQAATKCLPSPSQKEGLKH
jgi:hypothetical protein